MPIDSEAWFSNMLYAKARCGRNEALDRLIWGKDEGAPVGLKTPR